MNIGSKGMRHRGFAISEDNHLLREISARDNTWNYFTKTGLVFVQALIPSEFAI